MKKIEFYMPDKNYDTKEEKFVIEDYETLEAII